MIVQCLWVASIKFENAVVSQDVRQPMKGKGVCLCAAVNMFKRA